jgi:holo-[acyl-carrier protein] synthase
MTMIAGIGIDLVSVGRLKRILDRWDRRFTARVYTQREMDYCYKKAFPAIHFSARFAAKESFLKALGIGIGMGVHLKDIEVVNSPKGQPELVVHREAEAMLAQQCIRRLQLSLTHTSEYASAIVILEK